MTLRFIDLGINGDIQLLVLNDGVPYGIQNMEGGLVQFGASSFSSISGTANQITASAGPAVTLSLPAALVAPGSVAATSSLHAGTSVSAVTSVTGATVSATSEFLLPSYVKASLPAVGTAGGMIYVSDATGAHVTGSVAFSNGTDWIDVTTGIAVV